MTAKRTSKRIPSYRLHKPSGRAFVELNGKRIFLGPHEDSATYEKYSSLVAEWLSNGRELPVSKEEITVAEVAWAYWKHAEEYYRRPDGTPTQTLDAVRQAIKPLRKLYGSRKATEFGPKALRTVRETWVDAGLTRRTVNDYTGQLKRLFRWAASHELVDPVTYHGLATVEGLKAGRSKAKESEHILPVPDEHIAAVLSHVSRQVAALIKLQLLTGARPGEVVGLRPIDFDTSEDVWRVHLDHHKTSHRGRERTLYFGPEAKRIVKEFMRDRAIDKPLFSPIEAEAERHAKAESHRRPNQKPNPRKTDRTLGDQYTVNSYRKGIGHGIAAANKYRDKKDRIPSWTPHRLRHTAATRIRREFGLEAAQVILGHATADVTQIYAERNELRALQVVRESG